jgi:N-methylhydantoinase B
MLDPKTKTLDADGEYFYYASRPVWRAPIGTTFRLQTGGGGGWGDPLSRDPERVLRDVRDEYVTIAGALRDYGVVVTGDPVNDPEGLKIDIKATEAQRKKRALQNA